jgi:ribose 5-phosphate isomerase B
MSIRANCCGTRGSLWRFGGRPGKGAVIQPAPHRGSSLGARAALRIAIASDHAAFALKQGLAGWLVEQGHDVLDLGPDSDARVDYPDYGFALAAAVADGRVERGIALCGSGIGISIAVNRNPAVRCALVSEPLSAALAREHNDADVLAMGARLVGEDMARACISAFLATEFAGGRHQPRVEKLGAPAFLREPA